jgi:hypothetical protein
MRGASAVSAFDYLQAVLDGTHTLQDIVHATPEAISRATVLDVVKLLHQRGVLVDAGETAQDAIWKVQPGNAGIDPQMSAEQFWHRKLTTTRSANSAVELAQRIGASHVSVVLSGLIGQLTHELLERCGCRVSTAISLDGGSASPNGIEALERSEFTNSPEGLDSFIATLRDDMAQTDLLVVALHGTSRRLGDAINELVIETRTPLLFAVEDGETGEIMFVEPRRSACLACRDLRRDLTSEFALDDHLFRVEMADAGAWLPGSLPAGESVAAASLIAANVAGEVVRYLTAVSPLMFVNATMSIDLLSGESHVDRVLRVPRCTVCSNASKFGSIEASPG